MKPLVNIGLALLMACGVGAVVLLYQWSIPDVVNCYGLAFESPSDQTPFDGKPRQVCLATPRELSVEQSVNKKPPVEVSGFGIISKGGEVGDNGAGLWVCEHDNASCRELTGIVALVFASENCHDLKDGYSCRAVDAKGQNVAAVYRRMPKASADFKDIDLFLLVSGKDSGFIDDAVELAETAQIKK